MSHRPIVLYTDNILQYNSVVQMKQLIDDTIR